MRRKRSLVTRQPRRLRERYRPRPWLRQRMLVVRDTAATSRVRPRQPTAVPCQPRHSSSPTLSISILTARHVTPFHASRARCPRVDILMGSRPPVDVTSSSQRRGIRRRRHTPRPPDNARSGKVMAGGRSAIACCYAVIESHNAPERAQAGQPRRRRSFSRSAMPDPQQDACLRHRWPCPQTCPRKSPVRYAFK